MKNQYLDLAKTYHPDMVHLNKHKMTKKQATEKFLKIRNAYEKIIKLDEEMRGQLFLTWKMVAERERSFR